MANTIAGASVGLVAGVVASVVFKQPLWFGALVGGGLGAGVAVATQPKPVALTNVAATSPNTSGGASAGIDVTGGIQLPPIQIPPVSGSVSAGGSASAGAPFDDGSSSQE
jgi:hypothetical protein